MENESGMKKGEEISLDSEIFTLLTDYWNSIYIILHEEKYGEMVGIPSEIDINIMDSVENIFQEKTGVMTVMSDECKSPYKNACRFHRHIRSVMSNAMWYVYIVKDLDQLLIWRMSQE